MKMRTRAASALVLTAAALTPFACRDDVGPFRPNDRVGDPEPPIRLTYSPGDDQTPAWSADGDTVYYSAEGFESQPSSNGVLVAVPRQSGAARPLLANVQGAGSTREHWLLAPDPHPASGRIAFVEVDSLWPPHPCPLTGRNAHSRSCTPPMSEIDSRMPAPRQIAVRVRRRDATGLLEADPTLRLAIPGVVMVSDSARTAIVHNYPFLDLFASERAIAFRISWAPAGERLVLSDGLGLYIWRIGDPAAESVPDTEDAAWPAWSPDGDWIAFTRLVRADSSRTTCTYLAPPFGTLACIQERTDYTVGRRALTLIRPDGTGAREIGEGSEPAWTPDGGALVFRREDRLWRADPDGSNPVAIAGTEGGREPAVSPDGRELAFSRLSDAGDYEIWIVSLQP